ncbi:MAG: hypothetical protein EPN91_05805 [Salinibacterium sp.]|nr:MAG: hypothetical protein EPN91_05805 [Salinibacterium sp.]
MSDSYQAIYDAVRSRISGGNVGEIVADACRNAFDISWSVTRLEEQFTATAQEMARPSVLYKTTLGADGDMWCALLGENLQEGVAGFGKTPAEAMTAFDQAFWSEQTPKARMREAAR